MVPTKKHLPIYIAAEDIKQGQVVTLDEKNNMVYAAMPLEPLGRVAFPTLEELRNYATQGLSVNKVARLHNLSSGEVIRDTVSKYPDLKTQFMINGRASQHRKPTYE